MILKQPLTDRCKSISWYFFDSNLCFMYNVRDHFSATQIFFSILVNTMLILNGLCSLPWWGYVLVTLGCTHITIATVTIYLHRHQAHRAIDLRLPVSHFFRFWLWLTTGIKTREWVAVHRKHHARVETINDPHSPQIHGIRKVLFEGAELYRRAAKDRETIATFGHATPADWLERNLYTRYSYAGITLMLVINVALFGGAGITMWAVQMVWIPVFAAGVINGIGHWGGYRNFETADASTNIVPWGVLIGGEELHNNHHAFTASAKFSSRWWEIDLGWFYIRALHLLGLARIRKIAPRLFINRHKPEVDLDTVRAVIFNRMHVMSRYARKVVIRVYREEKLKADASTRKLLRQGRKLITRSAVRMDADTQRRLEALLGHNHAMRVVYEFSQRLQALWQERSDSWEGLVPSLRAWCEQAEATGIEALQEFARNMRTYTLQPA